MFERAAKENQKRKSELFQQTFLSSSYKNKRFSEDGKQDSLNNSPMVDANSSSNLSRKTFKINARVGDDSSLVNEPIVSAAAMGEQPVLGYEALVPNGENYLEKGKEQTMMTYKNKSKYRLVDKSLQTHRYDGKNESLSRQNASKSKITRSDFQYGTTTCEKEYKSKANHGEIKETKGTDKAESFLKQGTINDGKENTNKENKGETSTAITDFKSSLQHGTTSQNCRENQTSQGETKGKKGTKELGIPCRDENKYQISIQQSSERLSFSVQQDDTRGKDYISLSNVPPISVATTLYNNYKLLLITLAERLLFSDVLELKNWASQKFSIDSSHNATDIFFQLDQNGVINASNILELCDFFEGIVRYDLMYIIDAFLLGDYSLLWQTSSLRRNTSNEARRTHIQPITTPTTALSDNGQFSARSRSVNENPTFSNHHHNHENARSTNISDNSTCSPGLLPSTNFTVNPNNLGRKHLQSTAKYEQQNFRLRSTRPISTGMTNTVEADRSVTSDGRINRNSPIIGSNGFKFSKFQSPEPSPTFSGTSRHQASHNGQDINWLCSHYRRRCYVKFECCDKFWPCHRCHNNQSTCGTDVEVCKAHAAQMLKCVNCEKVQQFGEYCSECNIKFANYYCGLCKHLTGTDDHPFHCDKCGICRIHGDRSFHCDICGVCLDVQLRGNHKCREGSAHDECCICLEDAFTGCQILPCSHKVHKECATNMIRSGITRCLVSRESFAHKLERRPKSGSRKSPGK